jgi:hypothetical protein
MSLSGIVDNDDCRFRLERAITGAGIPCANGSPSTGVARGAILKFPSIARSTIVAVDHDTWERQAVDSRPSCLML